MPYTYLDNMATADVAFKAWGQTREELFVAAADAVTNIMVENLDAVSPEQRRHVLLNDESLELLLFRFLQELIFYKDAQMLFLRVEKIRFLSPQKDIITLEAELTGEKIDPKKHKLSTDIKAVTMHRFEVKQKNHAWEAVVVLDI